jgi:hypothetical protein
MNPRGRPAFGLLLVASIAVFCWPYMSVSGSVPYPAVSPNQDFSNSTLQLRAPASTGWHGAAQTPTLIEFGKSGSSANETFVAAVVLMRLPAFENTDAFTEYVREGVIKDAPSDRFETIESIVQYSPERGYPCVRYHGISNDRKPRISAFFAKTMRIEVVALYCEHPTKPGLGFAVTFSHRGGSADENIGKDAADFIDSVQVTPSSKAP